MDDLAALAAAGEEFGRRLATVGPDQWVAQTACDNWDVTALLRHINVGNRMSVLLLDGADGPTSVGPLAQPADDADPVSLYADTSAAQLAAFQRDGALAMTVKHPAMEMPGDMLLMFRSLDLALHALDLSTAIGGDADLDEDMCAAIWVKLEPIAGLLAGSGLFGAPTHELGDSPTSREKLIHATGR
jgi:uncharacterized protein (TIGR03086 family)